MNWIDKILNWYFTKDSLPYWCILIVDCTILYVAGVFTYWLVNRGAGTLGAITQLNHTLLIYIIISLIGFRLFRTYSGIIRYSSFVDLQRVAMGNVVSMFLVMVATAIIKLVPSSLLVHMRYVQIILMFAIATLIMWGLRVLVKLLHDVATSSSRAKRTLIYGVNDDGVGLAKNIRTQKPNRFKLKGFISNASSGNHHILFGEKVYPADENLLGVIKLQDIEAVLISPLLNKEFRRNQALQDLLINAGVKIYMQESAKEWEAGKENVNVAQLKEVSVEDLLPRDEIEVDLKSVAELLENKKVLITGSAGSIGSEIVRQVASFRPAAMMLIDQAETPQHDIRLMMSKEWPTISCETVVTSICNASRMEAIFSSFKPDYVFHAAAYKHVPMMEDNPCESVQNNVLGTKIIADLSDRYGVKKFVMVSTDKAVNPTNVMGCSKRICEIYVQALNKQSKTQYVTTRFGNVLGSNGSVIPLFREQIRNGGPLTVTHPDIIRYFMLIPEACKLVLEAGTKGKGGEIFVFDMGEPVRIADLAKRMIKLSGVPNIKIEFTGLRDGEKLYEEVLGAEEDTITSFHEKIRIAKVNEYDYETVSCSIAELIEVSHQYDNMATVKKMKEIVPEYISNNSVYSVLDKK